MANRYCEIIGSRYEDETIRMQLHPAWRSYWPVFLLAMSVLILPMQTEFWLRGMLVSAMIALSGAVFRYRYIFTITSHRVIVRRGLIAKDTSEIEIRHTREYKVSQGILERILNYGDIEISSAAGTGAEVRFFGIVSPHDLKEAIRGVRNGG